MDRPQSLQCASGSAHQSVIYSGLESQERPRPIAKHYVDHADHSSRSHCQVKVLSTPENQEDQGGNWKYVSPLLIR